MREMILPSNDLWNILVHEKRIPKKRKLWNIRGRKKGTKLHFPCHCHGTAKSGAAYLSEDNNNLAAEISLVLAQRGKITKSCGQLVPYKNSDCSKNSLIVHVKTLRPSGIYCI